jgi:hypothetical protein
MPVAFYFDVHVPDAIAVGQLVWDPEPIARASEPHEWRNVVAQLPL